jgi:hypothetical protein
MCIDVLELYARALLCGYLDAEKTDQGCTSLIHDLAQKKKTRNHVGLFQVAPVNLKQRTTFLFRPQVVLQSLRKKKWKPHYRRSKGKRLTDHPRPKQEHNKEINKARYTD